MHGPIQAATQQKEEIWCFLVGLNILDMKLNLQERPPCIQPDGDTRSGVVQVTRTSLSLVPGSANGHLSQSHDTRASHCQSHNEICMKQECLAVGLPLLINDSIHRRPMWNTFIIHYLFMQSILCIPIPPPAALH